MNILSCKGMRRMVVLSGLMFFSGMLLQVLLNVVDAENALSTTYIPYLAFTFTLLSPILLLTTVVVSLLPGEEKKMNSCEH